MVPESNPGPSSESAGSKALDHPGYDMWVYSPSVLPALSGEDAVLRNTGTTRWYRVEAGPASLQCYGASEWPQFLLAGGAMAGKILVGAGA